MIINQFQTVLHFYIPPKPKKTFWCHVFLFCQKMVHFMWILIIFKVKAVFLKIENFIPTLYLRINLLTLLCNFQRSLIIAKWILRMSPTVSIFLIGCYGNRKKLFVTMTTVTQVKKHPFTRNQNINLINSSSF